MKIIEMIKKLGGNRAAIAKTAGISEQQLNNYVSQKREVLQLASGDYVLKTEKTKIFKSHIVESKDND